MCVWTNRQHRHVPRSTSTTFVDDNNSTDPTAAELDLALQETARFDRLSGQKIHPGRAVGWAIGEDLWQQVSAIMLPPCLRMDSRAKLVGSHIDVHPAPEPWELNLAGTADARIRKAMSRLSRVGRLPEGMDVKAETARTLVACSCATGTDVQAPSTNCVRDSAQSTFAAIRPYGRVWVCNPVKLAVCVAGHALDLLAITQRDVILAVRRQARRDARLHPKIAYLREAAQSLLGGGPVGRLFQALDQLQWTWPALGTLRDDWGSTLNWLSEPAGAITHMLRAPQRRPFLRRMPPARGRAAGRRHLRL